MKEQKKLTWEQSLEFAKNHDLYLLSNFEKEFHNEDSGNLLIYALRNLNAVVMGRGDSRDKIEFNPQTCAFFYINDYPVDIYREKYSSSGVISFICVPEYHQKEILIDRAKPGYNRINIFLFYQSDVLGRQDVSIQNTGATFLSIILKYCLNTVYIAGYDFKRSEKPRDFQIDKDGFRECFFKTQKRSWSKTVFDVSENDIQCLFIKPSLQELLKDKNIVEVRR